MKVTMQKSGIDFIDKDAGGAVVHVSKGFITVPYGTKGVLTKTVGEEYYVKFEGFGTAVVMDKKQLKVEV